MRHKLESAIKREKQLKTSFRAAVAGEDLKRSDDTTYSYSDPVDAVDRRLTDLAAAQAAARVAQHILEAEGKTDQDGTVLTLTEAVRRFSKQHYDRMKWESANWSSNPISNAVDEAKRNAVNKFYGELSDSLDWEDAKAAEWNAKLAAKTAQLISDEGRTMNQAANAVAMMVTDPTIRASLDHKALEQALSVFALTPEYVVASVQADDEADREARDRKSAQDAAERAAKKAKQCKEMIWPDGGYTKHQCSKTGRFLVTFADCTQTLICGQHANSKHSNYKVGRMVNGKAVEAVVDTK